MSIPSSGPELAVKLVDVTSGRSLKTVENELKEKLRAIYLFRAAVTLDEIEASQDPYCRIVTDIGEYWHATDFIAAGWVLLKSHPNDENCYLLIPDGEGDLIYRTLRRLNGKLPALRFPLDFEIPGIPQEATEEQRIHLEKYFILGLLLKASF